jgi:hypothetical protein
MGRLIYEETSFNLTDDSTVFEQESLNRLAEENQIASYLHTGFGSAWIQSWN